MVKSDDVRISLLEEKFDLFLKLVEDMKNVLSRLNQKIVDEHMKEMAAVRQEVAVMHEVINRHEKRLGWIVGVLRSFLGIVGITVLGSILSTVIK